MSGKEANIIEVWLIRQRILHQLPEKQRAPSVTVAASTNTERECLLLFLFIKKKTLINHHDENLFQQQQHIHVIFDLFPSYSYTHTHKMIPTTTDMFSLFIYS